MPIDGVCIRSIKNELSDYLTGGKIDKISQPEKDEINMIIRNNGQNYKLILSASPSNARIHLTSTNKVNPLQAPMFCMILRKYLIGGKILSIDQPGLERILSINIENLDELGDISSKILVIEIMGRYSNIILTNKDNIILDSIKHVSENVSRVRQILPGIKYVFPPSQNKIDFKDIDNEKFLNAINNISSEQSVSKFISSNFIGISYVTAKEIEFRTFEKINVEIKDLDYDQKISIYKSMLNFFSELSEINHKSSILIDNSNKYKDFFPCIYKQFETCRQIIKNNTNETLDSFYIERDRKERIEQKSANIKHIINTNINRCKKKLNILLEKLKECDSMDKNLLYGDLITSYLYKIKQGDAKLDALNFYKEPAENITIPLDNLLTPVDNAQHYYKRYNKLKKSYTITKSQVEETKEELDYLDGLQLSLIRCIEESDIEQIKTELVHEGYIKKNKNTKNQKKLPVSKPHHYISSDGFDIFIGKNNIQNDQLTFKEAESKDIWLHVKNMPGSHVIIKANGKKPSESCLIEAAKLASYYSKGQNSSNVPVDYTFKKYVKKPNGAKPGFVIYTNQNTIYVTPSDDIIKQIRIV